MRVFSGLAALICASAIASGGAQAQPGPSRMFQASPPAACATALPDTGKSLKFEEQLTEAQRGALVSAIFLALHAPTGDDSWPARELAGAAPCPVARFVTGDTVWTIHGGGPELPPRWIRAPSDNESFFFLMKGPALADAEAWNQAGRRGLPAATATPGYYLIARMDGLNYVLKMYDGPPGMERLADDIADLMDGSEPPVAVHAPVGDAISLFVPTENGRQVEIIRPQDIAASGGYATLLFPDGELFAYDDNNAYVMAGSGFACAESYGEFERSVVAVHDPNLASLDLACLLSGDVGDLRIAVTRTPDKSADKAIWEATIRALEQQSGVARRLPNPPTGPRSQIQAGRQWLDNDGVVQTVLLLRRGEYIYGLHQMSRPESIDAANAALLALLEQIDLAAPRPADGPARR